MLRHNDVNTEEILDVDFPLRTRRRAISSNCFRTLTSPELMQSRIPRPSDAGDDEFVAAVDSENPSS